MEQHISSSQPQPPAFAEQPKPTAKVAPAKPTKVLSAAKVAAKAPKPKPVPARLNKKGERLLCMVGRPGKQCSNPQRHPHGKAWTCSTHHNAMARGVKVELKGLATLVWKAPGVTATA
jgi:hypothetical protein